METESRGFRWGSIVLSLIIGIGIIALAGSILMPSTKRARIDLDELRRREADESKTVEATSAAPPATVPATQP